MDNENLKTIGAVAGVGIGGYLVGRVIEAGAKMAWTKVIKPMIESKSVEEVVSAEPEAVEQ